MSQPFKCQLSPILGKAPVRPSNIQVVGAGSDEDEEELCGLSPDLYEMIKCNGCNKAMFSEIHICEANHNICHDCTKGKLEIPCTHCNGPMTTYRNEVLESIAWKIIIPCPNLGCPLMSFHDKIRIHQDICEHKVYICPMQKYNYDRDCGFMGNLENLTLHFNAKHCCYMTVSVDKYIPLKKFNIAEEMRKMNLFVYSNCLFLYHMKVNPKQRRISWAVQCIGPNKMELQWCYEIELYDKDVVERKVLLRERCLPYFKHAEKEIDAGNCVAIHLDTIKNHLNTFDELKFKFFMKEIEVLEQSGA